MTGVYGGIYIVVGVIDVFVYTVWFGVIEGVYIYCGCYGIIIVGVIGHYGCEGGMYTGVIGYTGCAGYVGYVGYTGCVG